MQQEMAAMKEKEFIQFQIGNDNLEDKRNNGSSEKELKSKIRENSVKLENPERGRGKSRDTDKDRNKGRGWKKGCRKEILQIAQDLQKIFQVTKQKQNETNRSVVIITKRESINIRAYCSSSAFLAIITCLVTFPACRARLYYSILYYIKLCDINHITSSSIALCGSYLLSPALFSFSFLLD